MNGGSFNLSFLRRSLLNRTAKKSENRLTFCEVILKMNVDYFPEIGLGGTLSSAICSDLALRDRREAVDRKKA